MDDWDELDKESDIYETVESILDCIWQSYHPDIGLVNIFDDESFLNSFYDDLQEIIKNKKQYNLSDEYIEELERKIMMLKLANDY